MEPFAVEAEDGAQMSSGLSHMCSKRLCCGTTFTEPFLANEVIIAMSPFKVPNKTPYDIQNWDTVPVLVGA